MSHTTNSMIIFSLVLDVSLVHEQFQWVRMSVQVGGGGKIQNTKSVGYIKNKENKCKMNYHI
jgi:hypothetical protein